MPVLPGDDQHVPPTLDHPPEQDNPITSCLESNSLSPTQKADFARILNSLKNKCRTTLQSERIVRKRGWKGCGSTYESTATEQYLQDRVGQLRSRGWDGDTVYREVGRWALDFKYQKRGSDFYQRLLHFLRTVDFGDP